MSRGALVVGLGQIGMGYDLGLDPAQYVYSHARAFHLHPGFHLLGGVDPEPERRRTFESAYHKPAFADLNAALAKSEPDVVVVAAPTAHHGEIVRRVLCHAPTRTILCEKPLSYDLAEARALVKLCAEAGVALYVNYIRRADPASIEIRRRLDSGEVSTPVKGVCWYSKGLIHNGSHFINLLEYWLGKMRSARILGAGRLWDGLDPEPDATLTFDRGTVVFLAAREEDFSHQTIELLSANGRLRYERGGRSIEWQRAEAAALPSGHTVLASAVEVIKSGMDRYQWHVAEQLAAALDGKTANLCDGFQALGSLEAVTEILQQ